MNCPLHEEQLLFINGYQSHGWCPICRRWYRTDEDEEEDDEE